MELNGKKKEINNRAMLGMIGKDYFHVDGVNTDLCKILDIVDSETVLVVNKRGEETSVSIFDLRSV